MAKGGYQGYVRAASATLGERIYRPKKKRFYREIIEENSGYPIGGERAASEDESETIINEETLGGCFDTEIL